MTKPRFKINYVLHPAVVLPAFGTGMVLMGGLLLGNYVVTAVATAVTAYVFWRIGGWRP